MRSAKVVAAAFVLLLFSVLTQSVRAQNFLTEFELNPDDAISHGPGLRDAILAFVQGLPGLYEGTSVVDSDIVVYNVTSLE